MLSGDAMANRKLSTRLRRWLFAMSGHKSNCVIFFLILWFSQVKNKRRAYFSIRKSDFCWYPHILYGYHKPRGTHCLVSYKPINPQKKPLPAPLFEGLVCWGDKPVHQEVSHAAIPQT